MVRKLLIALALACVPAIGLSSCGAPGAKGPSAKIDMADPFGSLRPWNSDWDQVKKATNNVEYVIVKKGDSKGSFPSPVDTVEFSYDMRLAETGEAVDATPEGETMTRMVKDWIPGFADALPKLQPGDTAMVYLPWRRAFGRGGQGIAPPRSDIMMLVTLHKVIPAPTPDLEAWKKATPWPENSQEVIRTASGLEYFIVKSADANASAAGVEGADARPLHDWDTAVLQVEGRLEDAAENDNHEATVFESSYADGETRYYPIGELVPGFVEALNLMRVGDHWMVRMPPQLGYGDESNGRILPNSTLVFEIDLQNIVRGEPPKTPAKKTK